MQTFTAHDSDVKSIAVDESGEFFVTGSIDGDIKASVFLVVIYCQMSFTIKYCCHNLVNTGDGCTKLG